MAATTSVSIVFATAFDQYAVKAFEVNAVDYLLKPFDKKRVAQSVQKARDKMDSTNSPEHLQTLVRTMLESQKPSTSKILLKAAGRNESEEEPCVPLASRRLRVPLVLAAP